MSKILITGGAGFVGYFLAEKFVADNNNEIVLVDNLSRGQIDDDFNKLINCQNVNFIRCDLTQKEEVKKLDDNFDYVYHLAAMIGVKNVMGRPDKVLYVNTLSILNLLEHFRSSKSLQKMFFSSTSEIYAGAVKHYDAQVPTPEDTPLVLEDVTKRRTTYALTKMFGESACFIYADLHAIPVVIGRYHNVYGPRMGFAHVIPETFIKVDQNGVVDVPSAKHTRAFCFIDDAIEMTIKICESDKSKNSIYNIGNPNEEISIENLVQIVADIQEKKITINPLAASEGSPERRCPNIDKWRNAFGDLEFVSLRDGIKRTFAWYKDRLDKRRE